MTNATNYQVVNKETGEMYEVREIDFGNSEEQNVTVVTDIGNIVFENKNQAGELINERYELKEVK